MLGLLTFLVPAVLGAAAAAAAPVIIHLIMRTKPRKIVFPALRFVRKTHQANVSRLRVKHLILLAMRMAAIVIVVGLIARAQVPAFSQVPFDQSPASVVVVVDNSGSMTYLQGSVSRLAKGKLLAAERLKRLPGGSRVAVVFASDPSAGGTFQDPASAVADIDRVQASLGNHTLGGSVRRAVEVALKQGGELRKEIVIVTDMTQQAWRDLADMGELDIDFTVLDPTQGRTTNLALGEPKLRANSVPLGATTELRTLLSSRQMSGEYMLRLDLSGEAVDQRAQTMDDNTSKTIAMEIRPRKEGQIQGQITLTQGDNMEMDNTRYFTLRVGSAARMLVVRDGVNVGRGDTTSLLMQAAVMPPGGSTLGEVITNQQLDSTDLTAIDGVVLANVSSLTSEQWKKLDQYVRGGGHLWVVAGELVSPSAYNVAAAQKLLPASLGVLQRLSQPMGWNTAKLDHPLVAPFFGADNPPLSEVQVTRRLTIEAKSSDAEVVVAYADGMPAILRRPVGQGACILWNFSPAGDFSNVGQLHQFPILAQHGVRLMSGEQEARRIYTLGETAIVPMPRQMPAPVIGIRRPGQTSETTEVANVDRRTIELHADQVGHYMVSFTQDGRRKEFGFSVNAPAAESDLTTVSAAQIQDKFPANRLRVLSADAADETATKKVQKALDLAGPLLLTLLALMAGEAFFANRFYKQPGSPTAK